MKRLSRRSMWLLVAVGLFLTLFFAASATGASDGNVTVDFQDTPIQTALATLFGGTGYSYTLDPGASGVVTVSLRDMPFLGALQTTLRAAGLTYTFENGVYSVRSQDSPNPSGVPSYTSPASPIMAEIELPPAEVRVEKIPLNFADAFDISDMFGSQQFTSRGNVFATGGSGGYVYGASSGGGVYGMSGLGAYGYGGYGGSSGSVGFRTGTSGFGNYGGYGSGIGGYNSGGLGRN